MEAIFKTSSFSPDIKCVAVAAMPAGFRTSSYSGWNFKCVEVSPAEDRAIAVRDSKQARAGIPAEWQTTLYFGAVEWIDLLTVMKAPFFMLRAIVAAAYGRPIITGGISLKLSVLDGVELRCLCKGCESKLLAFTYAELIAFVRGVRNGEFDTIRLFSEPITAV